jgi:SAM-dependent methyltransferase
MDAINLFNGHINQKQFNRKIQEDYNDQTAKTYRQNDERDICTPASLQVISRLQSLSAQFSHKINALDVGCGTGRFFHALKNIRELTGLDISSSMLNAARQPIHAEKLDIEMIRLIWANYSASNLTQNHFDLIYSVGVFGHPAPITVEVINQFHQNLAAGGKLMFTIANRDDEKYNPLLYKSPKRKMIEAIQPMLPKSVNDYLTNRWQNYFISQDQVLALFQESQFKNYHVWPMINRFICCEASKA